MLDADALLFSARGLTKQHGSTVAISDIDLDIGRGEIIGLVGENGAGKSTLMSILGGAYPATSGTMVLAGEPYRPESREAALAAGVSAIPQKFDVDPDLTVAEAIFSTSFQDSLHYADKVAYARELLATDGVQVDAEAKMGTLARAEQVCVILLRLSFEESHLVLLDEITATSNDLEISVLHTITNRLTKQGRSVVYISHRLDEVQSLSDRILVMREGRIYRELVPSEAGGRAGIAYYMFNREITQSERPEAKDAHEVLLELRDFTAEGLAPVSLRLHRGEVLGFTGMRRSGHSELAAAIGGARRVVGGELLLHGQPVQPNGIDEAIGQGIAYLSDEDAELGVADHDTVVTASAANGPKGADSTFAAEAAHFRAIIGTLQRLSISSSGLHEPVAHLSGGDQQKVALAKWLQSGAEVVVLNHPTRGVDVASREAVYEMVAEITGRGGAVILVSSDMSELIEQGHRIAVMRDGALVDVFRNADVTEDSLVMIAMGGLWGATNGRRGRRSSAE